MNKKLKTRYEPIIPLSPPPGEMIYNFRIIQSFFPVTRMRILIGGGGRGEIEKSFLRSNIFTFTPCSVLLLFIAGASFGNSSEEGIFNAHHF